MKLMFGYINGSFKKKSLYFRKLDRLTGESSEEDVMILVSHAGAIFSSLSLLTETPFEEFRKFGIPYAGGFLLEQKDGKYTFPEVLQ